MVVRKEDDTVKVLLQDVDSITLMTNQVFVSAYLLAEIAKLKISFIVSDEKALPIGQYLPLYGSYKTSQRIPEQISWSEPAKKRVWQRVVQDKISHQADILEARSNDTSAKLLRAASDEVRSGDSTGREAYAAKVYFQSLFGRDFNRDLQCTVNAALDYGYSIILSSVSREIVSRGYLTQLGICHKNEFNQFNLSCDLMEPFRPIIDKLVFDNLGDEFDRNMKLLLIDVLNQQICYRGGSYKVSSVISYYVGDCLAALNRRLSVSEISDFDVL